MINWISYSRVILPAMLLSSAGWAGASALTFSTSGAFGAGVTQTELTSPSGAFALSFDVNSAPAPGNLGTDGFDAPFTNFSYKLDGSPVAVSPGSIRFYGAQNGGLFTLFFGPESGQDSSGMFIPEFVFSGQPLFSGSTQAPVLAAGNFPVSEFLYTDNSNYDDQLSPGSTIAVNSASSATPEPASAALFSLAALLMGASVFVRWPGRPHGWKRPPLCGACSRLPSD